MVAESEDRCGKLVPLQTTSPKIHKIQTGALRGVGETWGVLSEATAERRIPLRPDGTRVSSGNAFGTSGSAAPQRTASKK